MLLLTANASSNNAKKHPPQVYATYQCYQDAKTHAELGNINWLLK